MWMRAPRTRRPDRSGPRSLALVAAAALLVTACGGGEGVRPGQDLLSGPVAVTGIPGLVRFDLSPARTQVFPPGSPQDTPIAAEDAAITAFGEAITAWLNTVLTERNNGQVTTFAATGLDATRFQAAFEFVDGTTPTTQIVEATYLIEVNHLGAPGWALVRVETVLVDAGDLSKPPVERRESFVFVPAEGTGLPQLIAFEAVK